MVYALSALTSTCGGTPPTGNRYVTVIIDLTPVRTGEGPVRLFDVVPGRSKHAFSGWVAARPPQ